MKTSIKENKLDSFDILSRASGELSVLAAACDIDWQKLYGLINRNQTTYKRGIELNKASKGKVAAFVNFKTARNGLEYPVITFKTFKHGEIKETFNGYSWWLDNKNNFSTAATAAVKKAPAKLTPIKNCLSCGQLFTPKYSKFTECTDCYSFEGKLKRYQETKALFDTLPSWISFALAISFVLIKSYLGKKGFFIADIQATGLDIRRGKDSRGGFIIYALRNIEGKITGFQQIYDEKFIGYDGELRDKDFCFYPNKATGKTLKQGSFAVLGSLDNAANGLFFCEGLATGLTVFMATGLTTIVCLDAGNLEPVLRQFSHISKKYIAADFDYHADNSGNTGIYSALKAARFNKARVFVPILKDDKGNFLKCDFDDLRQAKGIEEVKRQLKLRNNDNEVNPTNETLFKYCPENQLNKLALSHCYELSNIIVCKDDLETKSNHLQSLFDSRNFKEFSAREIIFSKVEQTIKTIIENDCFTGHKLVERIDTKGLSHEQTAEITAKLTGIVLDSGGLGSFKTGRMALVKDKLESDQLLSHEAIKNHFLNNGGTIAEWQKINNNPKLFAQLLSEIKPAKNNLISVPIAPRTSLVDSLALRTNTPHYQHIKNPSSHTQSAAICLPSIGKFSALNPDYLPIDEIRQTLEFMHNSGGCIDNPLAINNQLIHWSNQANLTIGADADLNKPTVEWLLANCPSQKIYWLDDGNNQITIDDSFNFTQSKKGKKLNITLANHYKQIDSTIADMQVIAKAGKSIVFCADSETQADKAYRNLIKNINPEKVLLITKYTKDEPKQKAFTANPNQESLKYQIIIYSPVISSGLNIEVPNFDYYFAAYYGVIPPNEFLQMNARFRKAKEINVLIMPNKNETRHTSIEDLSDGFKTTQLRLNPQTGNYELSGFDKFRLEQLARTNAALNNYQQYLCLLSQIKGYDVTIKRDAVMPELPSDFISTKDVKAAKCDEILEQPNLTDTEAEQLDNQQTRSEAEIQQLEKYHAMKMAGKTALSNDLTAEDIHFYEYDNGLSKVQNFELVNPQNPNDADFVKNLIEKDKGNHETRRKLASDYGKMIFINFIVSQLEGKQVKRALIQQCLGLLHENHQEVAINGLGNFKQKTTDTRKLNAFLEKCGCALVETGKETTGTRDRIYQLQVNEQVKTYADNRKRLKELSLEYETEDI